MKKNIKGDRQSVFFTAVNPMYANQDQEEIRCDLDKPRIAPHKNTLRVHKNTVMLVQPEARSKKMIAVLSNPIARNRSFQHTACDSF